MPVQNEPRVQFSLMPLGQISIQNHFNDPYALHECHDARVTQKQPNIFLITQLKTKDN